MSAKIPNDQFLLYCFDTEAHADSVRLQLVDAARGVDELCIRVTDTRFGYPRLRPMTVGPEHVRGHRSGLSWRECLSATALLVGHPVDTAHSPWRVHLFERVVDAPRCNGPALVVVLQISHALGDGRVVSSLARRLFGDTRTPAVTASGRARPWPRTVLRRSRNAQASERTLVADTDAGRVPAQAPGRTITRLNVAPTGTPSLRTAVRKRADFVGPGVSVTVGALTAVSEALSRYLTLHGESVAADLGAEVTFGLPGERRARNHFRNAGVGLFPETVDLRARALLIDDAMTERRLRAAHPAVHIQSLAAEMVPAVLLRWGVRQFDATAVPDRVTGNTVVSSVARGDSTLVLGGGPVRFTAGFPALSPVMALTHGVHGIGDTVTVSVTSARSAVPDPDVYERILHSAIDDVAAALSV